MQLSGSASRVSPNSEAALMAAVTISPVTVYFDVEASFQSYGGGIYSGTDCGTSINHASRFITRRIAGTPGYYIIPENLFLFIVPPTE